MKSALSVFNCTFFLTALFPGAEAGSAVHYTNQYQSRISAVFSLQKKSFQRFQSSMFTKLESRKSVNGNRGTADHSRWPYTPTLRPISCLAFCQPISKNIRMSSFQLMWLDLTLLNKRWNTMKLILVCRGKTRTPTLFIISIYAKVRFVWRLLSKKADRMLHPS